jgi:protein-S-isoprenylcysteine O-methyltransferase Ste14
MMRFLENKIPPPIIALLCAAGMWAITRAVEPLEIQTSIKWALIVMCIAAGAGFAIAGVLAFRRHHTTINPLHPEKTSSLVTGGIYRISRNPMYVGMAMLLLAWAMFLESPAALLGIGAFIAYITRFQIIPEERQLSQHFGVAFATYRQRVRRWL